MRNSIQMVALNEGMAGHVELVQLLQLNLLEHEPEGRAAVCAAAARLSLLL